MRAQPVLAVAGLTATVTATLITAVALRAQTGPPTQPPPAKPAIPAAASSIALRPDAFIGENVAMACRVETVLSKTVFTVDQLATPAEGKDVLVIAPYLQREPAADGSLTVLGEVFRFDPVEALKRAPAGYTLDLAPDVVAKYQGRPAVMARSVVTEAMEDIGKRLPPPLTPAEIELRDAMQAINANNGGLRTGLASPDAARIKEQIAALKTAFATADRFFKAQKADDAIGWTADAMKAIAAMEAAAAKSQWEDVRTSHATLGGLCAPCHGARRERLEDGSFRFRGEF